MFRSVRSRGDGGQPATIDLAPLIDCVFILLIFFLVTATFVRDTGVDVHRPQATVTRNVEPTAMRVSVTASGDIYTEGRSVSLEELRTQVRDFVAREHKQAVIVIPDTELPSGRLIEVMDTARQAGATDVVVATQRKGNG